MSVLGPVGWGCRIHECPGYDTKQIWWWDSSNIGALRKVDTPSLPMLPDPLWLGVASPDRVLSMGQIELNRVLMLNWIVWRELFLHLTVCKQKTVLMLNWIIWNGTVYMYKNGFCLNNLQLLICHKTKPNQVSTIVWLHYSDFNEMHEGKPRWE